MQAAVGPVRPQPPHLRRRRDQGSPVQVQFDTHETMTTRVNDNKKPFVSLKDKQGHHYHWRLQFLKKVFVSFFT